jgi:dinuclear metal center YbgI/SA1388 family protein
MVALAELELYINELLSVDAFSDYAPNGLQVEGRADINKIVTGVTASRALVEGAIAAGADLILVHHGYFWKGEDPRVVGMKRQRLALLLTNNVSLMGYHLPLDAHEELGNNAQLAQRLGLRVTGRFGPGATGIGMIGQPAAPLSPAELAGRIHQALGREPLVIAGGAATIETVAWCSGAAQSYIADPAVLNVDAYISGEISEQTVHVARELGIHYFSAGHHATERYGVQALGVHLAERFGLEHQFIDIDNPV